MDERRSRVVFWAALAALLLARSVLNLQVFTLNGSFFMLTGDDLTRTLYAYEWSQRPDLKPVCSLWTAGQFWLTGAALKLYPHPTVTIPLLNTAAGLGSVALIALIARALLGSPWLALAAAAIAAFQPILVWLSLSGLADGPAAFALLVGIFGWTRYRATGASGPALLGALGMLAASAVKLEYAAFTAGYTLLAAHEAWRLRGSGKSMALAACIPVAWLFVAALLVWCRVEKGDFLWYFSAYRQHYEHSWIAASTQSPLTRLAFYPGMLLQEWPGWTTMAGLGLLAMGALPALRRSCADMLALCVLPLAVLSLSAVVSGIPDNLGPGPRHVAVYLAILLIPAVSAAPLLWRAALSAAPRLGQRAPWRAAGTALPAALVAAQVLWSAKAGVLESQHPPFQPAAIAVNLGKALDELWRSGALSARDKVLFEPGLDSNAPDAQGSEFDSLTVRVFRPSEIISADHPAGDRIRFAVVHSLQARARLAPVLKPALRYGRYSFFMKPGDERLKQALSAALRTHRNADYGLGRTPP